VGCNNGGFLIYRSDDPFQGGWVQTSKLVFPPQWGSEAPGELKNEDPYVSSQMVLLPTLYWTLVISL
jgi:hypothetical protein